MSAESAPRGEAPEAEGRLPVLADVAQLAGVSQQTVSRVVRGSPSVARRTRERVEAAIAELGYRPNIAARTLVTRRSHRIGVVAADTSLYGAATTLAGIQEAARAEGYAVSLVMLPDLSAAGISTALEELRAQYVDGAIAVVPQDAAQDAVRAADAAFPCVLAPGLDGAGVPDAYWAEVAAAREATHHLLDLGHPTVHHVAGPPDWAESRARATGWRTALVERLRVVPRPVRGDWSAQSGYTAVGDLPLEEVSALFVGNDQMAAGVLRALADRGRRVPDEVSVVGFDDVPEARFYFPPLTTVHQDFTEIGWRCVRVLLGRLHDRVVEPGPVTSTLVVRSSTAPPPAPRVAGRPGDQALRG
ncbi:LacI family DNA-binding transcriptional regulator [Kineococcus radiotolerans]|uniref:Regulatory protein LacI n=1 Tax=Kineococcus radiotolerans (strain ATCC BAA-149 / DSM 14245 / SRS30216) TaxID=266940 RepID=A6WC72_KINRD|nr:LacI family DNA-binding transcriptional regulator [Kineococcus radiotolerans]ABS04411.1 regulatory protein LacI [Kineococcus radiotolerans SRS30216 = ATCC BAA-149]